MGISALCARTTRNQHHLKVSFTRKAFIRGVPPLAQSQKAKKQSLEVKYAFGRCQSGLVATLGDASGSLRELAYDEICRSEGDELCG